MRIIDIDGNELSPEDVDLSIGYLREEELLIADIQEQSHKFVSEFYFDDHTRYTVTSEDDPHVKIISTSLGYFDYIPDEGETRVLRGANIIKVVDVPASKQYETILRYLLYTEEELIQHQLPDRMNTAEEAIQETDTNVEDLILLLAEVLGGDDEEIEPEPEPTPDPEPEPEPSPEPDPEPEPEPSPEPEPEPEVSEENSEQPTVEEEGE